MLTWLTECFSGGRRLKPNETAIDRRELAVLQQHAIGKVKYDALIGHIEFMARFLPRRDAIDAHEAFLYLLNMAGELPKKVQNLRGVKNPDPVDLSYKFTTPQAFMDEMHRRRGIVDAAHVAARAGGPNVIDLPVITKIRIEPDKILFKAIGRLQDVVLVGTDKDGKEYFASSYADGGDILWHLERGKHKLMAMIDDWQKKDAGK